MVAAHSQPCSTARPWPTAIPAVSHSTTIEPCPGSITIGKTGNSAHDRNFAATISDEESRAKYGRGHDIIVGLGGRASSVMCANIHYSNGYGLGYGPKNDCKEEPPPKADMLDSEGAGTVSHDGATDHRPQQQQQHQQRISRSKGRSFSAEVRRKLKLLGAYDNWQDYDDEKTQIKWATLKSRMKELLQQQEEGQMICSNCRSAYKKRVVEELGGVCNSTLCKKPKLVKPTDMVNIELNEYRSSDDESDTCETGAAPPRPACTRVRCAPATS